MNKEEMVGHMEEDFDMVVYVDECGEPDYTRLAEDFSCLYVLDEDEDKLAFEASIVALDRHIMLNN